MNSPKVSVPSRTWENQEVYDVVNLRLVRGMRNISEGMSAAEKFSAVTNMPRSSEFKEYVAILNAASEKVCQENMDTDKEETVAQNSGDHDIVATFDGSCKSKVIHCSTG
ncbi:hypothetical protein HHI36_006375 [Cryptolaemus montrouzieri]|uniref:Uncharacterized protein n=1 Tax=Cryptolaemus montrouzieri TaxID=559131 RepID=A0ABD2NXY4_9CUCU